MTDLTQLSVPTSLFYGKKLHEGQTAASKYLESSSKIIEKYPFKFLDPATPTSTWKVFHKQKDALDYAKQRMNGVMTFVCQSGTCGERQFLVAHPRVFWFYDCRKEGQRCSYEIIVEHAFCKLYFDLEFSKELNPNHNGVRMTETFIKIVSFFLLKEWNIVCTRENILDLDSSTEQKFSRHLIYQLPGMIFHDNYSVGNFVKKICDALKTMKCEEDSNCEVTSMGITSNDFAELFINNKGKQHLFCDEGVYTKNRHFRLYCSSKWQKNSPLVRSDQNKWCCKSQSNDERLFLDSLITFCSVDAPLTILQCTYVTGPAKSCSMGCRQIHFPSDNGVASPYPDIDRFIRHLVAPGRIYRWCYSSSQNKMFYDIVGNRYCHNIGREHRSNNIRLVVDIENKLFYQRCYDPDCKDFSSEPCMLPSELIFILEGPISFSSENKECELWQNNLSEEDLCEVLDCIESSVILDRKID
ncbi:hypothetical protein R5R35_011268 [Gryllus longicercus]|uniref:DNA-directed primase/polymerase protein n=1 Tax=Gryllus longicercus TaxID=2509291 RepID=A0AAN9YYG2_9ORTH